MTVMAFTAYLREMMAGQRLKVGVVLEAAGVAQNYLSRLESGERKQPSTEIALALIVAVNGEAKHIKQLFSESFTEEAGRKLAQEWLEQTKRLSPTEREQLRKEAMETVDTLLNDPVRLGELIGFGKHLIAEQQAEHENL